MSSKCITHRERTGHACRALSEWFVFSDVFSARGGPCTHTLLTGGRFFIPRAKTNAFLDLYASVVVSGSPSKDLFFVERTGRLEYRMFADLDIKTLDSETVADDEALLERMLSVISAGSPLCTTVCVLRRLERHGGKMGFHIIWSDLYVDDKEAARLANEWMLNLAPRDRATMDTSVYRNGSLRMPWSAKVTRGDGDGDDTGARGIYVPWRLFEVHGDGMSPIVIDEFTPPVPAEFEYVRKWLSMSVLYPRRFDTGQTTLTRSHSKSKSNATSKRMSPEKPKVVSLVSPDLAVVVPCGDDESKYNTVFGRFLTNLMYEYSSCRGVSLAVDSDIIMAASDSSSRILMGNWSNHLPTMELYSNVANVNGNILATHLSTNTMNCTAFDIYMPSAGVGEYSNYTMPGTIADAYYASNILSGNATTPSIHILSNVTVGADWETWDPVYPVHVESQVNGISIFARYELAQVSDMRVKTNLEVIGDALAKVKSISGYTNNLVSQVANVQMARAKADQAKADQAKAESSNVVNESSGLVSTKEKDYLEQDEGIRGQRFACISFVSPEDVLVQKETFVLSRFLSDLCKDVDIMLTNVTTLHGGGQDSLEESVRLIRERYAYMWSESSMQDELNAYRLSRESTLDQEFRETTGDLSKTSIRGFKIRGVYGSLDEAKNRAKVISRTDNKFNVYIAEVGCWCPWSPNPDDITDCEYSETQLNTLMKNYYKQQETRNEMYDARKSGLIERIQDQRDTWLDKQTETPNDATNPCGGAPDAEGGSLIDVDFPPVPGVEDAIKI
eukprot:gene25499-11155_t